MAGIWSASGTQSITLLGSRHSRGAGPFLCCSMCPGRTSGWPGFLTSRSLSPSATCIAHLVNGLASIFGQKANVICVQSLREFGQALAVFVLPHPFQFERLAVARDL